MTSCKAVLSLAVLLLACAQLALAQAGGTYTTLDFPGAVSTAAMGIDTAGDIVGGFVDGSGLTHGFLLSGVVYTQLDCPGANRTVAYGINDVGQIVGSTETSTLGLFVYDIQTQTYTTNSWNGHLSVTATGINNAGVIVGWALGSSRDVGFELVGPTFQEINIPNAPTTQLISINDSGAFIGITSKNGRVISYLGQPGQAFKEITPPAYHAYATAINDSNVLAGNYVLPVRNSAFEWQRRGLFKPINEPGQSNTFTSGINSAGQVVGSYYEVSGLQSHGFLWTPPSSAGKK